MPDPAAALADVGKIVLDGAGSGGRQREGIWGCWGRVEWEADWPQEEVGWKLAAQNPTSCNAPFLRLFKSLA